MFEVAFICTGNLCRSPLAEALLQAETRDLPVHVSSWGLIDRGRARPPPEMLSAAWLVGIDLSSHRPTLLKDGVLREVDLIVGFELSHVAAAVVEGGADPHRTFTLVELVESLALVDERNVVGRSALEERAAALVAAANQARRDDLGPWLPWIVDPMGGAPRGYREISSRIKSLCALLRQGLFENQRRRLQRIGTRLEPRVMEIPGELEW